MFVCENMLETVRAFAHYKVTCRMGPLQHDMLIAFRETGGRKAQCSYSSHNAGIINSMCIIINISVKWLPDQKVAIKRAFTQA